LDWETDAETFPAPTESNIEALEFADGTVRFPTRTTVRSWKEMHERYRPRRVRQDPAGLDEMRAKLGPDRWVAWHVLGAVLHALRDRPQIGLAVHLGAQLPLLVRGLYYDQWRPSEQTLKQRSAEQFLDHVSLSHRRAHPNAKWTGVTGR
jgi:uncharacterized protein (DUF2267 family)